MNIVQKKLINNLSSYSLDSITELMKSRGIIKDKETPVDVFNRVVEAILIIDTKLNNNIYDEEFASDIVSFTEDKTFVFGTPILTNAGRKGLTTAACTVIKLEDKNGALDLEKFKIQSIEQLTNAIGTGYDLSELKDPSSELLKMNEILNHLDKQFINSNKRPVASMATLRADHPKILEFINTKQNVDYNKWSLNISIFVTEKLFQLAKEDDLWELKEYNPKTLLDETVGTIPAKQLLHEIAKSAHYCGEPGILFKDRFNNDNSTPQWEYKSTAPCAEVAMAPGEVCQFSYINLTNLIKDKNGNLEFDFGKLKKAVKVMTRVLDASVQITIDNDTLNREKIAAKRRIGIGVAGFAGMLINLNIPYDSNESVLLASQISELIDFSSKKESIQLSIKRGFFPKFNDSRYKDNEWIRRKNINETGIIPHEDWNILYFDIEKYGIRNASTTAFAPTGTSSRIVGTTTSFEPAYELVIWNLKNKTKKSKTYIPSFYDFIHSSLDKKIDASTKKKILNEIQKNNYIAPDHILDIVGRSYATAMQISYSAHLKIQSAFQKFVDESGAKTINLKNNSTIEEILDILKSVYDLNLKGLTIFRDKCLTERRTLNE